VTPNGKAGLKERMSRRTNEGLRDVSVTFCSVLKLKCGTGQERRHQTWKREKPSDNKGLWGAASLKTGREKGFP